MTLRMASSVELLDDNYVCFSQEGILDSHINNVVEKYSSAYLAPKTIGELLLFDDYKNTIINSVVFVQNKKNQVDLLMENIFGTTGWRDNLEVIKTHCYSTSTISKTIKKHAKEKRTFILEITDIDFNLGYFLSAINKINNRECGIFIFGFVRYLDLRHIPLLDVLFIFELSTSEIELLKSVVNVPVSFIKSNRLADHVLFFCIGNNGKSLLIEENPLLLPIEDVGKNTSSSLSLINSAVLLLVVWLYRVNSFLEIKSLASEYEPVESILGELLPFLIKNRVSFFIEENDLHLGLLPYNILHINELMEEIKVLQLKLDMHEKLIAKQGSGVNQEIKEMTKKYIITITNKVIKLRNLINYVSNGEMLSKP